MRTTRDAEVGFCNWLLVKNETLYLDTFCIRRLKTVASHQSECPKDIKQQMSCHAAAGPYVFQQATVIFSILSCALGFKNHFVYTVRGRQKADPCAPANPSQTIISEAFAR